MEAQHRITPTITAVRAVGSSGRRGARWPRMADGAARGGRRGATEPGVGLDRERVRALARALRRHRAESVCCERSRAASTHGRRSNCGSSAPGWRSRGGVTCSNAPHGPGWSTTVATPRLGARQLVERGAGDELDSRRPRPPRRGRVARPRDGRPAGARSATRAARIVAAPRPPALVRPVSSRRRALRADVSRTSLRNSRAGRYDDQASSEISLLFAHFRTQARDHLVHH